MRRILVLLATVLLASSCATRSDRVTTPPSIPTSLVPNSQGNVGAGKCSFTVGSGLGAVVSDVVATGPADGSLAIDDVVVAFGGTPIRTSSDLVAAVRQRSVGDVVAVDAVRDGESISIDVTLGESGEVTGRAMLGVLVTTLEEQQIPELLGMTELEGPLVRVVSIANELWLLDPSGISWTSLGVTAPEGAFIPIDGEVYTVEPRSDGTTAIVGAISEQSVLTDLADWVPRTIIGTLEQYILIGAERTDLDGTVIERSVIAINPKTGTAPWAWLTDSASSTSVPLVGHRSLDGHRTLIALGTPEDEVPEVWVVLSEVDGDPTATFPMGIPDGAAVLGWYDDDRLLALVNAVDDIALIDPDTGVVEQSTIPVTGVPTGLWPVGDGAHVLVEDGTGLVMVRVGALDRRVLTASCGASFVTEVGWIGG